MFCEKCGTQIEKDAKFCPTCGNSIVSADSNTDVQPVRPAVQQRITCPKCGGQDCQAVTETDVEGGGYKTGKGCCGYILLGPLGLLCGALGSKSKTTKSDFWVCSNCGSKFSR